MQADPGGGGITVSLPTVDWATLIPQLVGYFFDGIGKTLTDMTHKTFDGVWGSGANIVGQTALDATWNFGPIRDQVVQVQSGARAILLLALALLGLKAMLGGIVSRHHDVVSDAVDGVLLSVVMTAAFPVLVPELIGFTNQVATAIGTVDLSGYMATGFSQDPLIGLVLFVVLIFFGLRLLFRCSWRILLLAVLLPVGMFACAAYAIPGLRWLFGWWAKVWGGLLFAQIPSVLALSIGVQLFAHGSGVMAFMGSIAAMQVAVDMYTLLPGAMGGSGVAAPWGHLPVLPMLGRAAAAPAAVAATAIPTNELATRAEMYGY